MNLFKIPGVLISVWLYLTSKVIEAVKGKKQVAGIDFGTLSHTIRKYKKMAGQNTFQILVFNDANMIREH